MGMVKQDCESLRRQTLTLPKVLRGLAEAMLEAKVPERNAHLNLTQKYNDLLSRKSLFHVHPLLVAD
jgi:hypothetical protein